MAEPNTSATEAATSSLVMSRTMEALEGQHILFTSVATASFVLVVLWALMRTSIDPREPPAPKSRIPVFGHALGLLVAMLTDMSAFYYRKYKENPAASIITLPFPGGRRMYVIQDPQLMQAALRHRHMSFDPFIKNFISSTLALPKESEKRVMDATDSGLLRKMTQVIQDGLSGENLRVTAGLVLDKIAIVLNNMEDIRQKAGVQAIALASFWAWMRQTLAYATLVSLYGDFCPFAVDENLMQDLWIWDRHVSHMMLVPKFLEFLVCPEGYYSRQALQKGWLKYFKAGHAAHPSVAPVVKQRALTLWKHGWAPEDAAYVEQTLAAGSVQNATPTMLWLFFAIIKRPDYLLRIREEIISLTTVSEDESGKKTATLDLGAAQTKAPFFVACYHENIRIHKRISTARHTECDVELGGYLLKAGSDVVLPVKVASSHSEVWGQSTGDPTIFDPTHFLPADTENMSEEEEKEYEELKKARKTAWIPFGGGKHLCPGRNLAFSEILGFTGALLLGYDFEWDNEKGEIPDIKPRTPAPTTDITVPDEGHNSNDTAVRIKRKKEWQGVAWAFKL